MLWIQVHTQLVIWRNSLCLIVRPRHCQYQCYNVYAGGVLLRRTRKPGKTSREKILDCVLRLPMHQQLACDGYSTHVPRWLPVFVNKICSSLGLDSLLFIYPPDENFMKLPHLAYQRWLGQLSKKKKITSHRQTWWLFKKNSKLATCLGERDASITPRKGVSLYIAKRLVIWGQLIQYVRKIL